MTVIELGEMSRGREVLPPAPPVRLDLRFARKAAVVVIAVLTVLGVTGSTPSVRHTVRPLWSTGFGEGDSMTVDAGTLYAGQQRDGRVTLTAYDLATGRVRWAVPTGDSTVSLRPVVAGVLVTPDTVSDARIPQDNGTFMVQTYTSSTIARDSATGRALWTLPGDALAIYPGSAAYPGSVLLGENDSLGSLTRLRLVGLRDGATRWTEPVRNIDVWTVADTGGRPNRIVLGAASGVLTVLDYADGSTVRTGRLDARQHPDRDGAYASLQVFNGLLVASRADTDSNDFTVYRLADLQELWRSDGFLIDCGVVLCAMQSTGLAGRDPQTGQVRWRRTDLGGMWPLANGRFLGNGSSSLGPYQLVDPATGRGSGDLVRGEPTWSDGTPSGSVLLTGIVADINRSSVIQFDLDTGTSYLLGTISEVTRFGCQSTPGYLVCARPGGLDVTAVG